MKIQEPKVEFVELDQMMMTTEGSDPNGQEVFQCSGTKFQPDADQCSLDPSMF